MISLIVGRCHVGDSYLSVLRYVISRMAGKRETWAKLPRKDRRKLMRQIFKTHKANRDLFNYYRF